MNNIAPWSCLKWFQALLFFLLLPGIHSNAQGLPGGPGGPVTDTLTGPPGTDTGCAGFIVSSNTLDATLCEPCNGWVLIDVAGGTPPYGCLQVPSGSVPSYSGNLFVKNGLCAGTYTFIVADNSHPACKKELKVTVGGCRPDSVADTSVATIAGIARKVSLYQEGRAYPNPFTDQAYIDFYSEEAGSASLVLYSEMGIPAYKTEVPVKKGYNMLPVEGGRLARGMYYVRISARGHTIVTRVLRR